MNANSISGSASPGCDNQVEVCRRAGSEEWPFKLVIIGGGPSGCSTIVRAVRIGYINNLCSFDENNFLAGVCLLDKDSIDRLGGGRLQDYVINSNTYANKIPIHVLEDRLDMLPSECCTGTLLEQLKNSGYRKQLEMCGAKQGPLSVMGRFLKEVGSVIKNILDTTYPDSCECSTMSCVRSVERYTRVNNNNGSGVSSYCIPLLSYRLA